MANKVENHVKFNMLIFILLNGTKVWIRAMTHLIARVFFIMGVRNRDCRSDVNVAYEIWTILTLDLSLTRWDIQELCNATTMQLWRFAYLKRISQVFIRTTRVWEATNAPKLIFNELNNFYLRY